VPAPGAVYLATTVASWARCNLWRPEISDSDRSSQHSVEHKVKRGAPTSLLNLCFWYIITIIVLLLSIEY
jgi:hypothetical protein